MQDVAIKEAEKRIAEAKRAVRRAVEALDGVEDKRKRADLEYEIVNIGSSGWRQGEKS